MRGAIRTWHITPTLHYFRPTGFEDEDDDEDENEAPLQVLGVPDRDVR